MIHGGLHLVFRPASAQPLVQHCCIRNNLWPVEANTNFWHDAGFQSLRSVNDWDPGCANCQRLEHSANPSLRTGMNDSLKIQPARNLAGPARIDLMFDIGCNLACRTCGTDNSTFWQKYLQQPVTPSHSKEKVISALSQLDLSNLRMLVFCGGETLLGQQYWDVAEWLGDHIPDAKQRVTLCFQTNGKQTIHPRNYSIIDKFFLVKLHISLDGVGSRFEYLRWPASWSQVTDNILALRDDLPSNVMFLVEETISVLNLRYQTELESWLGKNFATNREGDTVNHTRHLARGLFSVESCSQEYVDWASKHLSKNMISPTWQESPARIQEMLAEIKQHDRMRHQQFESVFAEVADFYGRFM